MSFLPPHIWGPHLWRLNHAVCWQLDQTLFRREFDTSRPLTWLFDKISELSQKHCSNRTFVPWATALPAVNKRVLFFQCFAELLPCHICGHHYLEEIAQMSREDQENSNPNGPEFYFLWSVAVRARVSSRVGRAPHSVEECRQKGIAGIHKPQDPEWFASAWMGLLMLALATSKQQNPHPPVSTNSASSSLGAYKTLYFLHGLGILFPNMNSERWFVKLTLWEENFLQGKLPLIDLIYQLRELQISPLLDAPIEKETLLAQLQRDFLEWQKTQPQPPQLPIEKSSVVSKELQKINTKPRDEAVMKALEQEVLALTKTQPLVKDKQRDVNINTTTQVFMLIGLSCFVLVLVLVFTWSWLKGFYNHPSKLKSLEYPLSFETFSPD
jgi:hypothetical protein